MAGERAPSAANRRCGSPITCTDGYHSLWLALNAIGGGAVSYVDSRPQTNATSERSVPCSANIVSETASAPFDDAQQERPQMPGVVCRDVMPEKRRPSDVQHG
jgi:hypothetical protein